MLGYNQLSGCLKPLTKNDTTNTMNTRINQMIMIFAFLLGTAAIVWMAAIFIANDFFAFTITMVIAASYLIGFLELQQFRRITDSLRNALDSQSEQVEKLKEWLDQLHPSLRNPVQSRIEGERTALPQPVLTPYLVGLLVMLGLLGTFVGMVSTLEGAVVALQGNSELQAIREGLAAPIQGLGVAFGTSVAGVAASAMLGLMSTLSRRERMLETRRLDNSITSIFRDHSLVYNRQQTYKALQEQAQALPAAAEQLENVSRQLLHMGESISQSLNSNQEQFHKAMEERYNNLAASVGQSLQDSISESSRLTAQGIEPVIANTMTKISSELKANTEQTHQQLTETTQAQLNSISELMNTTTETWLQNQSSNDEQRLAQFMQMLEQLQAKNTEQQIMNTDSYQQQLSEFSQLNQTSATTITDKITALMNSTEQLIDARIATESQWLDGAQQRLSELTQAISNELKQLAEQEELRSLAATENLEKLQLTASEHLTNLGKEMEQPMARLIETASETPKAAAEVISHLRSEISNNIERDNQLLEERQVLMEKLTQLASSLEQSSGKQSEILAELMQSSSSTLHEVSTKFSDHVGIEVDKIANIVALFAGGTAEISSMGDAFSAAMDMFSESNTKLVTALTQIEQALDQSNSRSDEQLGYYVAQAREIIDHSILSQKQMIEELKDLGKQEQLFSAQES